MPNSPKNDMTNIKHKLMIRDHFSGEVVYWKAVYDEDPSLGKEAAYWLIKRMAIVLGILSDYAGQARFNVLDVGCGTGVYMREMIRLGHGVLGIDYSFDMVQEARSIALIDNEKKNACLVADIEALPIKNEIFDAVICVGVLQYLNNDGGIITELARVVRPRGIIILTIPNLLRMQVFMDPYYLYEATFRLILMIINKKGPKATQFIDPCSFMLNRTFWNRRYYFGQLIPIIREMGLIKLKIESVSFAPLTFLRKEIFPRSFSSHVSQRLESWSKRSGFRWIGVFADRWVICLNKK